MIKIDGEVFGNAYISDCLKYRYWLYRKINDLKKGDCVFVMLNPSTADAHVDDPTIRRCVGYAKAWGYSGLFVANMYGLRSTDPKKLWDAEDPVGDENDSCLVEVASEGDVVVCAWGSNAKKERQREVLDILEKNGIKPKCLGLTKTGFPRHPLYLKKDLKPIDFSVDDK